MKAKHIITAVGLIAIVVSIFCVARACRLSNDYRQLKLQYVGYRAISEADHKMSMDRIDGLTKELSHMTNEVLAIEAGNKVKDAKIVALSTRLDELQNAEPPTTPEVEAMPIVINLRGQIAKLTEMFSLAQEAISARDTEISILKQMYANQVEISNEWKANYDREHALRLSCEGLVKHLESSVKASKFLNKAAIVAVAGAVAYGLLK